MEQRDLLWNLMGGDSHRLMRRRRAMCHPVTTIILVLVLVAQSGYAGTGSDKMSAPTPRPSVAREASRGLGKVAVTSGRFVPRLFIDGLEAEAETTGIERRTLSEGTVTFENDDLHVAVEMLVWSPILFLMLPALPVFAVLFWIDKPTEATEAEVQEVNERLLTARKVMEVQGIQTQGDFRDRVVAIGRSRTPHTLTVLADRGPTAVDERPDYRSLSQEGIQTVLEVVIEETCLFSDVNGKPLLFLCMTVNTRMVRTVDNAEIYAKSRAHLSDVRTLTEWIDGPEGFRNELDRIYLEIAEKIVNDVFLRTGSN